MIRQPLQANGYTIHLGPSKYTELNQVLTDQAYTKIFILVDTHTNEYCSPIFLPELATHIPIELIEIEPGEA